MVYEFVCCISLKPSESIFINQTFTSERDLYNHSHHFVHRYRSEFVAELFCNPFPQKYLNYFPRLYFYIFSTIVSRFLHNYNDTDLSSKYSVSPFFLYIVHCSTCSNFRLVTLITMIPFLSITQYYFIINVSLYNYSVT
ncbi:unnamed protein product [Schistosoma intercalatum]|nr:unnamed protein product [Schistosoma intercalatum]CAH8544266.1 unnamed protein product [Schistosoma intercalatum]